MRAYVSPCAPVDPVTQGRRHGRKLRGVPSRVSLRAPLVKIGLQQSVTTTPQAETTRARGTARSERDPPPAVSPVRTASNGLRGGPRGSRRPSAARSRRPTVVARTALPFQHTHRSTKPSKEPPGEAQRSTTESTLPGVSPLLRCPSSLSQHSRDPSATTSTRPSSRFVAAPVRPSSNPRARVHQRKPTPCTRPRTHAVSRTGSPSCPTAPNSPLPHGDTLLTDTPRETTKAPKKGRNITFRVPWRTTTARLKPAGPPGPADSSGS